MKTALIVLAVISILFSIIALIMTYITKPNKNSEWFLSGFISLLIFLVFFAFYQAEQWREMYQQAIRPMLE